MRRNLKIIDRATRRPTAIGPLEWATSHFKIPGIHESHSCVTLLICLKFFEQRSWKAPSPCSEVPLRTKCEHSDFKLIENGAFLIAAIRPIVTFEYRTPSPQSLSAGSRFNLKLFSAIIACVRKLLLPNVAQEVPGNVWVHASGALVNCGNNNNVIRSYKTLPIFIPFK